MKEINQVHFTLGDNAGILLMQIAQEALLCELDPEKAVKVITTSLMGCPNNIALKIHLLLLLLWGILCALYTLFEIAVFLAINVALFIWKFKLIKWSSIFYANHIWENTWDGNPYIDYTPWDTFKRHYKMFANGHGN